MQRALLAIEDPDGFLVQISEATDQRSHLESRRAAKREISSAFLGLPATLGGFDHISLFCTDYRASREFYVDVLGMEEIFHSATREPGEAVPAGFEQGAFAVGGTDIEMATDATWQTTVPGRLSRLGFWTDDVEHVYRVVQDKGLLTDGPPSEWTPLPPVRRRAFTLRDPDGLLIQIAQHF
jgi:catechol 2,3-dioxygenase-like lactoylglutathione lyase family enzyme